MAWVILNLILAAPLFASQAEVFGLGGNTTGRVGSVTAESENPYAAPYNPAVMALAEETQFAYATSFTSSNFGDLLPSTHSATWSLGFIHPFFLPNLFARRAAVGLSINGPYNRLRSLVAHAPEDVYSMRYGTSDSQFRATLGGSTEIWPDSLFLGMGLSVYLSGAGAAETTLNTQNPTGRFALDVGLNTALIAGVLAKFDETQAALVYHQAMDPTFVQTLDAQAQIGTGNFRQPATLKATLYYEPHELELEGQHQFEELTVSLGVSYQFWSQYRPAVLFTETVDSQGNPVTTAPPTGTFRNTLNPRTSAEMDFFDSALTLAVGYQFRPTPAEDLSGSLNSVDSNTHVVGASLTHRVRTSSFTGFAFEWGLFGQYHWSEQREITKRNPAPGTPDSYNFSANASTYGAFLKADL